MGIQFHLHEGELVVDRFCFRFFGSVAVLSQFCSPSLSPSTRDELLQKVTPYGALETSEILSNWPWSCGQTLSHTHVNIYSNQYVDTCTYVYIYVYIYMHITLYQSIWIHIILAIRAVMCILIFPPNTHANNRNKHVWSIAVIVSPSPWVTMAVHRHLMQIHLPVLLGKYKCWFTMNSPLGITKNENEGQFFRPGTAMKSQMGFMGFFFLSSSSSSMTCRTAMIPIVISALGFGLGLSAIYFPGPQNARRDFDGSNACFDPPTKCQ